MPCIYCKEKWRNSLQTSFVAYNMQVKSWKMRWQQSAKPENKSQRFVPAPILQNKKQ